MSTDLTLQLRPYGKPARFGDGSYAPGAGCYSLHCEAADRIDELEAELALMLRLAQEGGKPGPADIGMYEDPPFSGLWREASSDE